MMNLRDYLGKKVRIVFDDNQVLEGFCNSYTNKLDTDEEIYDEITIRTDKYPYVSINESEIKSIEII